MDRGVAIFAVRFTSGETRIISMKDIMKVTRGKRGVQVLGPTGRTEAQWKIEQWNDQENAHKKKWRKKEKKKATDLQRMVDLTRMEGCIAMIRDGSVCGRTNNLIATELGPLCGEHAKLCKKSTKKPSTHEMNGYTKENMEKAEEEARLQEVCSAHEGLRLPSMTESLKKDRRGLFAVVAVRTFHDDATRGAPAGSVWLSSDKAFKSNKHEGEMKILNEHKDIFENIEEAKSWVEAQVMSGQVMELEAQQRWKGAQEKARSKRKDKLPEQTDALARKDKRKTRGGEVEA